MTVDELTVLKSDLKTWAADVAAERITDDAVVKAHKELRVAELERDAANAKVAEYESALETGVGKLPSASTLATAKGIAEHSAKVVKGRRASLTRAQDDARVAQLQSLAAEVEAYSKGEGVPDIAAKLVAAVDALKAFKEAIEAHNAAVVDFAARARTLGAGTVSGPAKPDPERGGIVVARSGEIHAGNYKLQRLDEVSLLSRANNPAEAPEAVAAGVRDTVNRLRPFAHKTYYRLPDGSSKVFEPYALPDPVEIALQGYVELDFADVWDTPEGESA